MTGGSRGTQRQWVLEASSLFKPKHWSGISQRREGKEFLRRREQQVQRASDETLTSYSYLKEKKKNWPHRAVSRILVLRPGMEPKPTVVGAGRPNHWATREVLMTFY